MMQPESMRDFALLKTSSLLDDLVFAITAAGRSPDVDTVHKMRVAIRRLQQALRLFGIYLRKSGVAQIKKELRVIMDVAGELRNRDIAIKVVGEAGGDPETLLKKVHEERSELKDEFARVLQQYAKPDLALRWRSQLGVEHA
jgi:CHAD domain-containing protein